MSATADRNHLVRRKIETYVALTCLVAKHDVEVKALNDVADANRAAPNTDSMVGVGGEK